jgi:hypothetical protein
MTLDTAFNGVSLSYSDVVFSENTIAFDLLLSNPPTGFNSSGTYTSSGTETGTAAISGYENVSDSLFVEGFGFSIPSSSSITGVTVTLKGYSASASIDAKLIIGGSVAGTLKQISLPTSEGSITLGSTTDLWGTAISADEVNSTEFGVCFTAPDESTSEIYLEYVSITISRSTSSANFNLISTYEDSFGNIKNVALDANGDFWVEDVTSNPGILTSLTDIIDVPVNSYATAANANSRLYMAISSGDYLHTAISSVVCTLVVISGETWLQTVITLLTSATGYSAGDTISISGATNNTWMNTSFTLTAVGTDTLTFKYGILSDGYTSGTETGYVSSLMTNGGSGNYPPMQYTDKPEWADRVSQCGPGAPPSFTGTLTTTGSATVTAFTYSSGILTLTAANTFTAGEVVAFTATSSDALYALNGLSFNVLGTGLSTTAFEISSTLVTTASGTSTATVTGQYTYAISSITQNVSQPTSQTGFDGILWSAGVGSTSSGNVITIYYSRTVEDTVLDKAFSGGLYSVYVYVTGTAIGVANGTFLVTSIGKGTPPGASAERYYFTYSVTSSSYQKIQSGDNSAAGRYEMTIATVVTSNSLPGVETGDQITITDASVTSWDNTWTVLYTPYNGSYTITETAMTDGVATYSWEVSGSTTVAPTAGQLVTILGTTNGDLIFNVTDASISNVTGSTSGTFTIEGFDGSLSYSSETEEGSATTSGTQFIIDPGPLTLGTTSSPIYGTASSGYIKVVGSTVVVVSTGTRRGVVFFITRNGFWTAPSPYIEFTVSTNANYILASNIPIGPPEVIARGIAFTEAGSDGVPGASYYTIPTPVQFVYNSVTYTSSQLIINDNTTTYAKFTFTDTVLLAATEIDIDGNNLFNLAELGDSAWNIQYAGRMVWGKVRNKIQNMLNMSFDGGYLSGSTTPLGWNTYDSGASLAISPIYGDALYIDNSTSATISSYGMIAQSVYQDQSLVAILQTNTLYSVRVTCRQMDSSTSGNLVIDLSEYNSGTGWSTTYGTYTLALSSMASSMATYEGTLLTSEFTTQIPSDLYFRVWAENLPAGAAIEIDRIELFPTIDPVNLTDLSVSYKDNLDSYDQITGKLTTSNLNQQPTNGGFVMRGRLYILKENSMGFFSETQGVEPTSWNPFEEISNVAGACGINAYDYGEDWAIMANQSGLYVSNGGTPSPIQLEIPDIWSAINWDAAKTICVRNDFPNRRIYIACPMSTPNTWLPDEPTVTDPLYNNVVILLNWEGISTVEGLMEAQALHVTMMGSLAALDMRRKYSLWTIATPYIGFIKRSELNSEIVFCNGISSSQISKLDTSTYGNDNGTVFLSLYTTYGFVDKKGSQETPLLGMFNKRFIYWDFMAYGSGTAKIRFLQNVLSAPYPFTVAGGMNLLSSAPNDYEGPLNVYGIRIFVEVSSNAVGSWFNLSHLTLTGRADAWAPLRGAGVTSGV